MGYLQQEMIKEMDMHDMNKTIVDLEADVKRKDASIRYLTDVINVLSSWGMFLDGCIDNDMHRDALEYVANKNGANWDANTCREILVNYGCTRDSIHQREYAVSVTVPMYLTISIMATDEDHAYDVARDEIADMWASDIVQQYEVDFDSYNVTIDNVEEC